jgi:hypothetical protein
VDLVAETITVLVPLELRDRGMPVEPVVSPEELERRISEALVAVQRQQEPLPQVERLKTVETVFNPALQEQRRTIPAAALELR